MIKEIDEDENGEINLDEFTKLMKDKLLKEKNIEEEIERAFRYFAEIDQITLEGKPLEELRIDKEKLTKVA